MALGAVLERARDRSQVAAFEHGTAVRLMQLEQRVRAWHAAFATAPGQRYVLHCASALEFVTALLGAWHAGKCVLVPSDLQAASLAACGISADGTVGGEGGVNGTHEAAWAGELPPLDPERAALEIYTSGSTGKPAAHVKCLRQLEAELAALAGTLDLGPPERCVLGTVSHQHMYGLIFRVLLPLCTGRPFEAFRLRGVEDLALLDSAQKCVLVSSPAQLARLPPADSMPQAMGRVGAVLAGGGPLGDEAVRSCAALFGVAVTEIYGSSETGAVAYRQRTPGVAGAWQALPGVELAPRGGVLEIRTRQLPDAGWFRSADRVIPTAEGFRLAGRVDRIVKLEEKRVCLEGVARGLMDSGLVLKAHALVLERGTRPVLAVAATPSPSGWAVAEAGKRALVDRLREQLVVSGQGEVLPRSWRFVDPWPLSFDGKTPEVLLRERFDRRNPEFRVLEQDATGCVLQLWVSPSVPYFAGHFPGQPVLAGVAQIDWLVWLSGVALGVTAAFAGLEAAKFRRVILPGSTLSLSLRHDAESAKTAYQIFNGAQLCASGRIRWEAR